MWILGKQYLGMPWRAIGLMQRDLIVELNELEIKTSEMIGRERYERHIARSGPTRVWTPNDLQTAINSIAAEIAVAKVLNIYPQLDANIDITPEHDLVKDGKRIDVKYTALDYGNLLIAYLHEDIQYVLAKGAPPKITLCGYIPGEIVPRVGEKKKMPNVNKLGWSWAWQVRPSQLAPIKQLAQYGPRRAPTF